MRVQVNLDVLGQGFSRWEHDKEPKYRCCCGTLHIRAGAVIMAIVQVLYYLLMFGRAARNSSYASENPIYLSISFVVVLIGLAMALAAIYGIAKIQPMPIVAFFFWHIFILLKSFLYVIFAAAAYHNLQKGKEDDLTDFMAPERWQAKVLHIDRGYLIGKELVVEMIIYIFRFFLTMWSAYVMYYCFCYVRDRKLATRQAGQGISLNQRSNEIFGPPMFEAARGSQAADGYGQHVVIDPLPKPAAKSGDVVANDSASGSP